jgi:hypothetical protein
LVKTPVDDTNHGQYPWGQNNVGVLDTATNVFTTVATTGAAASGHNKYDGAVAVGDKVYFARLLFFNTS